MFEYFNRCFLLLTPTASHLHSGLREVDLQRHLLPHKDVRVARLCEQRLQDVELRAGEGGALPPLLPWVGWRNITKTSFKKENYMRIKPITLRKKLFKVCALNA